MLAEYRRSHPELKQVVFRVGTILGETTRNQITALFERPRLIAIRGSKSPFVFIWDQDVVGAIEHAIFSGGDGIYNVAGDGALSIQEIAARLGKRCVTLPPWLLRAVLAVLHPLGCRATGPSRWTSCATARCSTTAGSRSSSATCRSSPRPRCSSCSASRTASGRATDGMARRSFDGPPCWSPAPAAGSAARRRLRFAAAGARIAALDKDACGPRIAARRTAGARRAGARASPATSPTRPPASAPSPRPCSASVARRAGEQRRHQPPQRLRLDRARRDPARRWK